MALELASGASGGWGQTGNTSTPSPGAFAPVVRSGPTPTYTATPRATTTPVPHGVEVLSSSAFIPYSGSNSLLIVGEVWNVTGWGVDSVRIDATLRDADDNGVGSEYTYSMIGRLADGMTSPFSVWFSDPPGWASYDLEVTWNRTSEVVFLLGISNSTRFFDNNDACHVVGEAWNPYGERRSSIKAVVTLYDATGTVIGAGYSFTDPDELEPGQTASFDVEVAYWVGRPDRSRVAVHRLEVVGD